MTKTFILILFVKAGYAGGLATAEFATKEACLTAASAFEQELSWGSSASYICVEKGTP